MLTAKPLTRAELQQELEDWTTEIKGVFNSVEERLDEHSRILKEHSRILSAHTVILSEHTQRLTAIEATLHEHTRILEQIARGIRDMVTEQRALTHLYQRLDYRDHVFADALKINLREVDAKFTPPQP